MQLPVSLQAQLHGQSATPVIEEVRVRSCFLLGTAQDASFACDDLLGVYLFLYRLALVSC